MKQLIKNHQKAFYAFMIFNILVPLTNVAFAYSIKGIIDSGMSQNKEELLLFSSMQHSTLYLFD